MVLDETTEEGRLFHMGIVLGKKEFFSASLKHCDVIENSPVKKVTSNDNGHSDKPVLKFYRVFLVVLSGIVLFN